MYRSTTNSDTPPPKMSIFSAVEVAAPIEVFHVNKMYQEDNDSKKVNLSIGGWFNPTF